MIIFDLYLTKKTVDHDHF